MTILVLQNLNFTNFEILKFQLIFEISLQIFACDHGFYRFQNNSKQYGGLKWLLPWYPKKIVLDNWKWLPEIVLDNWK